MDPFAWLDHLGIAAIAAPYRTGVSNRWGRVNFWWLRVRAVTAVLIADRRRWARWYR
jgi:hypothetical protein